MKIGTMFNDILRSFFSRHTTQLYPVERIPPPERYRGILSYRPSLCTGCSLCVKDCPSDAIELVLLDRAAKKYVVNYHMDRCIYCGQCVVNYKFKCISMSSQDVIETGQAPENRTGGLRRFAPDLVLIVDAGEMRESPGAIRWIPEERIDGMSASTHSLPLSMLAYYLKLELGCRVMFLGIQPASNEIGERVSAKFLQAIDEIIEGLDVLLCESYR